MPPIKINSNVGRIKHEFGKCATWLSIYVLNFVHPFSFQKFHKRYLEYYQAHLLLKAKA